METKNEEANNAIQEKGKIEEMNVKAEKIAVIMDENIQTAIKRGEDMVDLEKRAADLESGAKVFKKKARAKKRSLWIKNASYTIIILILFLLFGYFVVKLIMKK